MQRDEKTVRALRLTEDVIKLNAANYTAWHFRRLILDHLKSDLHQELDYTTKVAADNPKNYQLWYHRRAIVERLQDPSLELDFTAEMFEDDAKNYHAWAHRQWVLSTFQLWENELDYVDTLLRRDLRNNSAWNERYFVISRVGPLSPDVRRREIQYTFKYIKQAPNNQSSWNYLKGILSRQNFEDYPEVEETCLYFKQQFPSCANAVSLLVDIYEQKATQEHLKQALEYCVELSTKTDTIHSKYWDFRANRIRGALQV